MKIEFTWNPRPRVILISTNSLIYCDVFIPLRRACAYVLVQFEVTLVFSMEGMDMRNNFYLIFMDFSQKSEMLFLLR